MNVLKDIDFLEFIGKQEQQFLDHLSSHVDDIKQRISSGVQAYGDPLPWDKTHQKFRLRPGEVSLWCGVNGHGKSQVLSHITAHLCQYAPCLIASLEMSIPATGQRLMRQMIGVEKPTEGYIDKAINWLDERLWVYDQLDSVETERILGMAIYAMQELGIKHIVIDSLLKCGVKTDDYNSQKEFVDRLCWAAKTHNAHIHLVHHMRKGKSEEDIPDKFDVKGAGEITDLVDNVIIVHRNKAKERAIENGETIDDKVPDAVLGVVKQRHGEYEGRFTLWFHKESQQYLGWAGQPLQRFDFEKVDLGENVERYKKLYADVEGF